MEQYKSERLVIIITASLKNSIEEPAKKQSITASELVRKVLEIERLTRELRHYRKLSYSHQLKATEIILEEKDFTDT